MYKRKKVFLSFIIHIVSLSPLSLSLSNIKRPIEIFSLTVKCNNLQVYRCWDIILFTTYMYGVISRLTLNIIIPIASHCLTVLLVFFTQ